MTPEIEALARRAVACPRWRWMPGMLDQHDRRVLDTNTGRNLGFPVWWTDAIGCDCHEVYEDPDKARSEWADALPNLTDPATLGCLLALVRRAYNDPFTHVEYELGEWIVWATPEGRRGKYSMSVRKTEAEALVRALERAP
jgi:hypothetical protein